MLQSSTKSLIEDFMIFIIFDRVSDAYIRPLKFDCLGYPTITRLILGDLDWLDLRKLTFSVSRRDFNVKMAAHQK